jgi:ABC-type glutathione transport system ATPase component
MSEDTAPKPEAISATQERSEKEIEMNERTNPQQVIDIAPRKHSIVTNMKEFTPITVSFHDLSFSVSIPKRKQKKLGTEKVILKNISGIVTPGTLLALMGSSGAGILTFKEQCG